MFHHIIITYIIFYNIHSNLQNTRRYSCGFCGIHGAISSVCSCESCRDSHAVSSAVNGGFFLSCGSHSAVSSRGCGSHGVINQRVNT